MKRETEAHNAEEEYVKSQGTRWELMSVKERQEREKIFQESVDPATCPASITVSTYKVALKGKKPQYVVMIPFVN